MARKACFYPDGSRMFADIPCSRNGDEDSVCCGPAATCLSNKICWDGASGWVRGSCTDPTWKSSACPQFCLKPAGEAGIMNQCLDLNADSWCCSESQKTCDCSKGNVTLPGTRSLVSTIPYPEEATSTFTALSTLNALSSTLTALSSANSSITSSSIITVTPSSTVFRSQISLSSSIISEISVPTPTTSPTSNSTNLGIVIGTPVAVLSLALVVLLLWFIRLQRQSRAKIRQLQERLDLNGSPQQTDPYEMSETERKFEMRGESSHELPGNEVGRRHELPMGSTN